MARLYLVRHGEPASAWGDGDAAAGDPGLSALGRKQAEATAALLRAAGRLAVFSSPMRRCRETAAALAPAGQVQIAPAMTEVAAPEGVERRTWLLRTFPRAHNPAGAPTAWSDCGPDVETWRAGGVSFLSSLRGDAAVFTHFIAINAAVSAALGRTDAICFRPAHCSVTVLKVEHGALRMVSQGAEVA